jgi:putative Mg2+ transporter-C (MgtC) family protein
MDQLLDSISQNWTFVARLLVAMLLGSVVGMERQTRGRAAGLRTNILVCLGSATVIVAFQKLSMEFGMGAADTIRMDPARAAAGVITGIGFLGAGTIMKSKDFIRGLTTAATIWVVSAIGVAVGLGEYTIASVLTILVLLTLFLLHRIPIKSDHYFTLRLKWTGDLGVIDGVTDQLSQEGAHIKHRGVVRRPKANLCQAEIVLRTRKGDLGMSMLGRLEKDERFDEVSWS